MLEKVKNIIKDKTFLSALIVGAITYLPVAMYAHISMDTYTAFVDRIQKETYLNYGKPLRFFVEYISKLLKLDAFSPYFAYIISIFMFALAIYFLISIFLVKNDVLKVIAGLSIVLPMFNDYYLYMHDVVIYSITYLTITYASFLAIRKRKYVISCVLISIGILIYQPFSQIPSSIFVLYLMKILIVDCEKFYNVFKQGLKLFVLLLISFFMYFVVTLYLGSNANINSNYLLSLFKIYAMPLSWVIRNHIYINITIIQKISILLIYILSFVLLIKPFLKLEVKNKILFILLFIAWPFAMNFIYLVFCGGTLRYVIGMIYLVVTPMIILDNFHDCKKCIYYGLIVAISIQCFMCFYCEQVRIYQCKLIDDSIHSYCTEMVAQIKNTEGYTSKDKICFVKSSNAYFFGNLNDYYIEGNSLGIDTWTNAIGIGFTDVFKEMIQINGAYKMNYVSSEIESEINNSIEYKSMPIYPDYGSIKRKDGIVIIRIN